ncbi:hypothetical protein TCAL_09779 [Tigriopus californicus]|uniref:Kazal-like domain-containing protein n=1 Tax=Tigriopus californicus TaxID=6832 RepID=A0A553PLJ9_TIGCA|nr:hypothetical protein TCAL_09779 [Tigriopus californicus]|eukprot:TCALIF_09779-PA protein Name:"Protein of unknown function" AED:0.10 eAED:0.10 QI:85/0.5/1/1/0.5/0.66/3/122/78
MIKALSILALLFGAGLAAILEKTDNCIQKCTKLEGFSPVCDEANYQYDNNCIATECSKCEAHCNNVDIECEKVCGCWD